ncbi:hypothetical protein H8356DRAFT_1427541 [Neocallimastix lanati (nom. inval.)]|nr:hypothetical protein H8356DRAFT_1427541 [Neocallimastix sp. JGI-2020a]
MINKAIDCRSIGLRGRIFAFQANGPGSIPVIVYTMIVASQLVIPAYCKSSLLNVFADHPDKTPLYSLSDINCLL